MLSRHTTADERATFYAKRMHQHAVLCAAADAAIQPTPHAVRKLTRTAQPQASAATNVCAFCAKQTDNYTHLLRSSCRTSRSPADRRSPPSLLDRAVVDIKLDDSIPPQPFSIPPRGCRRQARQHMNLHVMCVCACVFVCVCARARACV